LNQPGRRLSKSARRADKRRALKTGVSNYAAAYIADALMDLALQFEATHFAQIRRHYQSITPNRDDDDPRNSTCSANIPPSERWAHSFVRPAPRAFFRPDRQNTQPPRAGPVKAGRAFAATRRAWP